MVREPLVHRNDIPGEPRASRRRNATSMVQPRHSADDAGAVRVVFARYAMGGRSQNRRQPSPEISRVVSQTRTFLQRRHGRRSKTLLERAEFFNVSASAGQCRNSNRPHGKTHGSALLRGIKSAKSSLVVTKIDRLARSVRHLCEIVDRLQAKGVALRILNMNLDTNDATGKLMLQIIGSIAEFERSSM